MEYTISSVSAGTVSCSLYNVNVLNDYCLTQSAGDRSMRTAERTQYIIIVLYHSQFDYLTILV